MATRALIGYFDDDRVLTSTYNHYDGYPDHLGKMLDKYFSNEELAKKIAGTGYISYIDDDGSLSCPSGDSEYVIGAVGEKATCPIHGNMSNPIEQ